MSEQADRLERVPLTEEEIRAAHVAPVVPLAGSIHLAEYDPAWPGLYP